VAATATAPVAQAKQEKNAKQTQFEVAKNNINSFVKADYANNSCPDLRENKAKQSQFHRQKKEYRIQNTVC